MTTRQWLRRRLPRLLLELALLFVFVFALEQWLTRAAVHGPAPPFAGATVDGRAFSLEQLRGQPALVHFWATWCPICELEHGALAALAEDAPVITVAMQSGSAAEVASYLRRQGLTLPVVVDEQGELARVYGVTGVPASFVLDRTGAVRFVTRGYTSGWGLRLRLWLAGL